MTTASNTSAPQGDTINDALTHDFPQAASLSREDLQALLEDEAYFDAFFNTLPQAQILHQAHETKLVENIAIAQKNDGLKPKLEALRAETANLFAEANQLKAHWTNFLEPAQVETYKRFTLQNQLNRFRYATSGQEHLSESLVNSFIDGGMDEEDFVKQYKEIRKVYHRRATSLRKWEEGKVQWRS